MATARVRRGARALLALAALMPAGTVASAQRAVPYVVIVDPTNTNGSVNRKVLEDVFLKRVTRWPGDEAIHPVDLPPNSPVRRQFSDDVLHRSVEAVKQFWQQRIFSGRDVPPPELEGDAEVVQYVQHHRGAVGYVSGGANLSGAKVLSVR